MLPSWQPSVVVAALHEVPDVPAVDLKIETEGNPEQKRVEVMGTSSEFSVETFGKPKSVMHCFIQEYEFIFIGRS